MTESEKTHLQKERNRVVAEKEKSQAIINYLRSALEEEQTRSEEERKSHQQTLERIGSSAV